MVTVNNAQLKFYVDGKEEIVTTFGFSGGNHWFGALSAGTHDVMIGKGHLDLSDHYFGKLADEVRVYNRALSPQEVRYHYNRGGPVAYWKFDEGTGTTTYDGSGNNKTGQMITVASSPTWVSGKYGSALNFDGTNDYIQVADNSTLDITDAITLEAWVYDPPPEINQGIPKGGVELVFVVQISQWNISS